ncbi:IclR family transcriptional regulator [Rhizobium sp. NFACC06-2]|uniref:IclR family transcriptional regulator n=1 Tax=Rhizobium sp. NFACC06-2 TaxID=1566264 RepID=UPI00122D19FE|nr:IclR family transcriptional regulator [Rhizobium sp. NFACC06-2]
MSGHGSDHRKGQIVALEKALSVLELFGPERPELRITDIARMAEMNRSSAQRIVHTLVETGLLLRDEHSSTLTLSHRVADLAHTYLTSNNLIEFVMPSLVDLNASTGLSCDLWLLDKDDVITLARVPSPVASLTIAPTGQRLPLAASAPGRALLGLMSDIQRNSCLQRLVQNNRLAPASATTIEKGVEQELAQGFAFDAAETKVGQTMLAVAFRNASGDPLAAISLAGPSSNPSELKALGQQLSRAAHHLSELRISNGTRPLFLEQKADPHLLPIPADTDPLFVNSVGKGIHLLRLFRPSTPEFTLTELHRLAGFPIPTVQRLTETLISTGYLLKDDRRRTFELSVRALDLLFKFQMSNPLLKVLWPRLIRLREECGLRCSFCILDGTEIVHLLHVQSRPHPSFRTAYAGRRLPSLSSSGGRAILSYLTDHEIEAILGNSVIEMATPHTIANKELIRQEIKDARQRGYAFTDRQSIREEVNVAAAILDANRRPLGAIVVSAPVKNWSIERLDRVVAPLLLSHARSGGF